MGKTIFKNNKMEIHFGINSQEGFISGNAKDAENALKKLGKKKLWRCNVCNDLHLGTEPPKECPTCHTINAYVKISEKEFRNLIGI